MPAVTPPYIPRFGAGAPVAAAPDGTIYYDTSNNYVPYIRKNGGWNRTSIIYEGAGAPAGFAPDGALYSRPGQLAGSRLYQASNGLVTATLAQHAHGAAHNTGAGPVFGVGVTTGNLLLAIIGWGNDQTAALNLAAWNVLDSSNAGNPGFATSAVLYRYAQAGDGTTPPTFFTTGGNQFWGYTIAEISGVTGNIATDIASHTLTGVNGASYTTPHQSTTTTNQLALFYGTAWDGTANIAVPGTFGAVDQWNDGAANYGAQLLASQTPGSGVDIGNLTVNRPAGGNSACYGAQIILAASQATTWTAIA